MIRVVGGEGGRWGGGVILLIDLGASCEESDTERQADSRMNGKTDRKDIKTDMKQMQTDRKDRTDRQREPKSRQTDLQTD